MHVRSGKTVETDPPLDNQGLGEAFSPTDLLATSLGACMLTIFAQAAQARSIDIGNPSLEVTKDGFPMSMLRAASTLEIRLWKSPR
jgi:uncharacterized OsmC-like protein